MVTCVAADEFAMTFDVVDTWSRSQLLLMTVSRVGGQELANANDLVTVGSDVLFKVTVVNSVVRAT